MRSATCAARLAPGWALVLALLALASLATAQQPPAPPEADPFAEGGAQAPPQAASSGVLTPEEAQAFLTGTEQVAPPAGPAAGPAAFGPASQIPRLKYQGMAVSAYAEQPVPSSGLISLACGFAYQSELFRSSYVGVSPDMFSRGLACGRCIRIQCDDMACRPPGGSLVAQVVDQCGDCQGSDIALSLPAFANLTGGEGVSPVSTLAMSWDVVDCAPFISGSIKMYIKPGGSLYYQSFSFSNSIEPIIGVMINGVRLRPSTSSAYWEWNPGKEIDPRGRFDVVLAGASRQFLRVRIR
ncbi:hypothetical protein ABPG75_000390 [Micractinium tetrahymenae]